MDFRKGISHVIKLGVDLIRHPEFAREVVHRIDDPLVEVEDSGVFWLPLDPLLIRQVHHRQGDCIPIADEENCFSITPLCR
jgi:hypothetical protein